MSDEQNSPASLDGLEQQLRRLRGGEAAPTSTGFGSDRLVTDATVLLDTAHGGLDAVRSATAVTQRQIVLTAGDVTIVVDIDDGPDDGSGPVARVSGQVIGGVGPFAVQAVDGAGLEVGLVTTDVDGAFELEAAADIATLFVAGALLDVAVGLSTET